MSLSDYWKKCSVCKKEIAFEKIYQVCTVSTCHKSVFCSVECFDVHVPLMNHKNAWAEERRSPRRILLNATGAPSSLQREAQEKKSEMDHEILIVASKLKQYVKDKADLNTSANVMDKLSDIVREITDRAIEKARAEGRKTLMDRDF